MNAWLFALVIGLSLLFSVSSLLIVWLSARNLKKGLQR